MATNQTVAPNPADLLSGLLDAGYTQQTGPVIAAIVDSTQAGPVALRLEQFQTRAQELTASGQAMSADDPVLRALLADFGDAMRADALLINQSSGGLLQTAIDGAGQFVRQTTLPGWSDNDLTALGIGWNVPDPAAIAAVVDYTSTADWEDLLSQYADGIAQQVADIALRGIISGQGPLAIAADIQAAMESIPAYRAESLMRTLQLTAFRDAIVVSQVANADILEPYAIRVATLDGQTCLACIGLSGSEIPINQRVDDHWQGRCVPVAMVRGRKRNIQTGEDWLKSLPEAQQRAQMGNAAYEAWKAGAVQLQDFVHKTNDPVFGGMVTEASLKGILGDAAKAFYQR